MFTIRRLFSAFYVITTLWAASPQNLQAQALCGPGFGVTTTGAICVQLVTSPVTSTVLIPGSSAPMIISRILGDYEVNMVASFVGSSTGMGLSLGGTVEKIGNTSPGSTISITLEGGRAGPLAAATGSLNLSGYMYGVGQVQVGGAAGFPVSGTQDLEFVGFPQTLDTSVATNCGTALLTEGPFDCSDENAGPVAEGSVAIRALNVFNLIEQGKSIDIPSYTISGRAFLPGAPNSLAMKVPMADGKMGTWPVEQAVFRDQCIHPDDRFGSWWTLEGWPVVDPYPDACGFGPPEDAWFVTMSEVYEPYTMEGDVWMHPYTGVVNYPGNTLIIPQGNFLTFDNHSSLVMHGILAIYGRLDLLADSRLDNEGTVQNLGNTIVNSGELYNWSDGTIENPEGSTIMNLDTGTIFNDGTINNQGTICNDGAITGAGTITGNAAIPGCNPALEPDDPVTGLFYNASESGWGVALTQQGDIIFVTLYTYNESGVPIWYVASRCDVTGLGCTGLLYEVTGGSALTDPWDGSGKVVREVGTVTFSFTDIHNGTMTLDIDGVTATKTIERQQFRALTPGEAMTALWYAGEVESGWGATLIRQSEIAFVTVYTYDTNGNPMWYVASKCEITGASCTGKLYEVSGGQPIFDPWLGTHLVVDVGTLTVAFIDDDNGTMTFTINGVSGSKTITRQVFN